MTYPSTAQVTNGDRVLMIAQQQRLRQTALSGRLADVEPSQPFWALTSQAQELADAGLAGFAPDGTPWPDPQPPWTAAGSPGFAAGAANVGR